MSFEKFFNWKSEHTVEEFIKKYPNIPYEKFRGHESISSKFISENMDKPWNFYDFTGKFIKDKVSFDFIFKYKEKNWDWNRLTFYFGFSLAQKHPELPWNWNLFFQNGDITSSFLEKNLNNILLNWGNISLYYFYRNFPYIIIKYPKPFWSVRDFSYSVPWNFVEQNLDYPWDWEQLSKNSTITWDIVKKHPVKPWVIACLLQNLDIDLDLIDLVPNFSPELVFNLISNGNPACIRLKISKTLQSRQSHFKIISEKLSPFSRNIDKLFRKRINYV
jgi:hypothetical protein